MCMYEASQSTAVLNGLSNHIQLCTYKYVCASRVENILFLLKLMTRLWNDMINPYSLKN